MAELPKEKSLAEIQEEYAAFNSSPDELRFIAESLVAEREILMDDVKGLTVLTDSSTGLTETKKNSELASGIRKRIADTVLASRVDGSDLPFADLIRGDEVQVEIVEGFLVTLAASRSGKLEPDDQEDAIETVKTDLGNPGLKLPFTNAMLTVEEIVRRAKPAGEPKPAGIPAQGELTRPPLPPAARR